MKGKIYKITNKVNGKSYIGQTRYTIEFRWRQHQHKKDNTHFHNAISKYGAENFTVELLEECELADMDSREIYYIAKYDTYNHGYNSSTGGDGMKGHSRVLTDDKYEEIKGLYLSGFSSNKIATLYRVDKATIQKLLRAMGVKLRTNKLSINKQEFDELVADYRSGYSLRELAKRYDCSGPGLKEYLQKKGVDLRERYSILDDNEAQQQLVNDYVSGMTKNELMEKYHCMFASVQAILSKYSVNDKRHYYKMSSAQCLRAIEMFADGMSVKDIAKEFDVNVCTIYAMFKRYNVNYQTV